MSAAVGGAVSSGHSTNRKIGSKVVLKLAAIDQELQQEKVQTKLPWIKTPRADTTFGIAILLNAAFFGVEIELGEPGFSWPFWIGETCFLIVFTIEISLRIYAERPNYSNFIDAWGVFDTAVTALGVVDAWIITPALGSGEDNPLSSLTVLRMFRLFRLVRLIRVLRMFNELVVLVQTLHTSMKDVAWMSLLLLMIMYTGSVITVILIGQPYKGDAAVDQYFGSLGSALFSHFCIVTLENWPDIALSAMKHNSTWALYFIAMIIIMNFALVNLMVGVIVERIIRLNTEQENELASFVAESEQFRSTLQTLFDNADMDASGEVTKQEIRDLLNDARTHDIMNAFGINLNIPPETLHTIMDLHDDGPTNFKDFFNACMRLCGSKQSIHSVFVQHDICECQRDLVDRMSGMEEHIKQLGSVLQKDIPIAGQSSGGLSVQATIPEVLDRIDRFSQVQQTIYKDICSLRDLAKQNSEGPSILDVDAGNPFILTKTGQDVGQCCIDTLFSHRKFAADPNLRANKRRELEAEFRSKHAVGR